MRAAVGQWWHLFPFALSGLADARAERKSVLWTLPCARVIFIDADIFPMDSKALHGEWAASAQLSASGEGGPKGLLGIPRWAVSGSECFNSGFMHLRPSKDVHSRYIRLLRRQGSEL